ncbi:MAG: hypothetical protein IT320_09610 [Anaerolineae bacterium]|nr:hypothetical protein [Anaerolineae bacterium]
MTSIPTQDRSPRSILRYIDPRRASGRLFWAFAILMLITGGLRLAAFPRYLPYSDHWDEPSMVLLARDWRGVEQIAFIPDWLKGYPPLYIWINMGVQQVVEATSAQPWIFLGDYLNALRLLAALSGIATTLLVIALGWQTGGSVAAWCAGLAWGLSPIVIEHGNFAIPDPLVYLSCALSLNLTFRAYRRRATPSRMGALLIGGLLAGIAAIYLKYTAVFVLIPWAIVLIVMLAQGVRQRAVWLWTLLAAALSVVTAGYLVFGYGAFSLSNNEGARLRVTGLAGVVESTLDPARNLNNLMHMIWPIGIGLFAVVIVLGLATHLLRRRSAARGPVNGAFVILLLIYSAACLIITSSFFDLGGVLPTDPRRITESFVRHVLPGTLALCVLWGAGAAQIVHFLQGALGTSRHWIAPGVCTVITAIFLASSLPATIANVQSYRLPDTRMLLWQWADVNLPLEGDIALVRGELENTWNRYWGGYDGQKPFTWWYTDTLPAFDTIAPDALAEQGIAYVALTDDERAQMLAAPGTAAFVEALTPVRHIPASADVHGPGATVYRTTPPSQSVDGALFGDQIALVGYDLEGTTFRPGDVVRFRPYWRAPVKPGANLSMFIHVRLLDDPAPVAQYDGNPAQPGRLTLQWDDPEELIVGPWAEIALPGDLVPGDYDIALGLYDCATGVRLTLADGADSWRLPITVGAG